MDPRQEKKRSPVYIFATAAFFTLFLFSIVVVAININLRREIQDQIVNRDAETLYLFLMMDLAAESADGVTEIAEPWGIQNNRLTPSLWSSDQKGIIALQMFDAEGTIRSTIPESLIPAVLNETDFDSLKKLTPVSRFHDSIWLTSLFDDPRYVLLESPVPLLEVIIPVPSPDSGKLKAVLQYWIEGEGMSRELSRLNKSITIQTVIALGIGYLIILTIFFWTSGRLKLVNRALYDEIEHRKSVEIELKQYTEELFKSREQLAAAQQISRLGSLEWDLQTNDISFSDEAYRIMSLDPGCKPLKPEAIVERIHCEDREMVTKEISTALRSGAAVDIEHRLQIGDLPVRYVRQQGQISRDDLGRPAKLLGTIQDFTAEKLVEEETQRLRDMLSNIVDSMPTVLIGIDTEGSVTQWNRQAELTTAISRSEAQTRRLAELLPQIEIPFRLLQEAIEHRKTVEEIKIPLNFNGSTTLFDMTAYPLISGKQVRGGVVMLSDISERVKLEEMVVHTEKMLTVGGLAAGLAHEINNPLAAIIQSLQVMRNRLSSNLPKNDQVARECETTINAIELYMEKRGLSQTIANILNEGSRASKIVLNMLNFSRDSHGSHEMTYLPDLLDKSLELVSNEYNLEKGLDFRRIQVVKEFDAHVPKISCDENRIQQVFINILKNGAQAMAPSQNRSEPPLFILRVKPESDQSVRIEIEDNGPGMDEVTRKKAFEPFFTTKDVGEGTGLGLSVSYYIVTDHQGSISIDSEPGKGSVFIITLPVTKPDPSD